MRLYDNDEYREEFMAIVYGLLMSDGTNDRANQIISAFDCAPEVEAEPVQPNDPLTEAEMKEMGGEPYWHVGLQKDSHPPHWSILDPYYAKNIKDYGYGVRWIGYRRKLRAQRRENPCSL